MMKKRTLFAAILLTATSAANAGLSFDVLSTTTRTEAFDIAGFTTLGVGSTVKVGTLKADNAYRVTYTYLGSESGFDDVFHNLYVFNSKLFENVDGTFYPNPSPTNPVGTSVSGNMTSSGALDFAFAGVQSATPTENKMAYNDRVLHAAYNSSGTTPGWANGTSIGLIGTNMTVNSLTYAYVIGFNDSAGSAVLGDWDDMVIGVNIAPIPEPETYAMLLAGLGLMGFVARRRKQSASV